MRKSDTDTLTQPDKGAALMAWYCDAISKYPDGLITQAQTAAILGINRVQVARLINRQHLHAVYFPQQTRTGAIKVSSDDPFWLKVVAQFDKVFGRQTDNTISWPEACYVSFKDVLRLHADSRLMEKCKIDWFKVFPELKKKQAEAARKPLHNPDAAAQAHPQGEP